MTHLMGPLAIRHTHLARDYELQGMEPGEALGVAAHDVVTDFYADSNEERAKEFACEFRSEDAVALLTRYAAQKRVAELSQDVQEGPTG